MEPYTEFRTGDHFITVTYDNDAVGWLMDEFGESYPGVFAHDHAWTPHTVGDEMVGNELQNWEDELDNLHYEVDHATNEYFSAYGEYLDVIARRVVDAEESATRREVLSNATAALASEVDELQNHLDSNRWFTSNHSPYVDTNGYFVIIDKDEFCRGTGLERDMSAEEWEKHATDAGKYVDTLVHGYVYHVEITAADFDDDTGEYEQGDYVDSLGGIIFNDNFPNDDEILEFVRANMGL